MNNKEQEYTSFDEAWIGLPAETIAQRAFKAGWDAHQQLLQQTQCTTLFCDCQIPKPIDPYHDED